MAVNRIFGFDGDDTLSGMDGDDIIEGGNGSDFITGGLGFDTLMGGAGIDVFRYNSIGEAAFSLPGLPGARETINDFNFLEDQLSFNQGMLKGVFNFVNSVAMGGSGAWSANSTNSEAMFDDVTDTLTIDTDGDGAENMEIVMTNVNEADLSPANFIFV
jgi:Ca2+-binding RTX toxin-like protein